MSTIISQSDEVWMPIPNFEGIYLASSHGRVKAVAKTHRGNRPYATPDRILKPRLDRSKNYLLIGLVSTSRLRCTAYVHRLVASAFCEKPECAYQVNHLDGNKLNNRPDNLEWCTRSQNAIHSYQVLGQQPSVLTGIENPKSRPITQRTTTGELVKSWANAREASDALGFDQSTIHRACKRNVLRYGYAWSYA